MREAGWRLPHEDRDACSSCARWNADVDGLGLGGLELGLRLHHVGLGRHPVREPVLRQGGGTSKAATVSSSTCFCASESAAGSSPGPALPGSSGAPPPDLLRLAWARPCSTPPRRIRPRRPAPTRSRGPAGSPRRAPPEDPDEPDVRWTSRCPRTCRWTIPGRPEDEGGRLTRPRVAEPERHGRKTYARAPRARAPGLPVRASDTARFWFEMLTRRLEGVQLPIGEDLPPGAAGQAVRRVGDLPAVELLVGVGAEHRRASRSLGPRCRRSRARAPPRRARAARRGVGRPSGRFTAPAHPTPRRGQAGAMSGAPRAHTAVRGRGRGTRPRRVERERLLTMSHRRWRCRAAGAAPI